jgi:hypothetical protein
VKNGQLNVPLSLFFIHYSLFVSGKSADDRVSGRRLGKRGGGGLGHLPQQRAVAFVVKERIMDVRRTLKELADLAVAEVGFCTGIAWRSVTGSNVPDGMISARCRLAYVLFSGFDPAYRFYALLARTGTARLPGNRIRLVSIEHNERTVVGVAVIAIVSPDSRNPTGFRPAPAYDTQPGYIRYFRAHTAAQYPSRAWWDDTDDWRDNDERFTDDPGPDRRGCEERDDAALELLLDRIEAEYDEKLWWYGVPGRRTQYPPALRSVRELFAYARRPELDPEEIARRNRERQSEQWLIAQHERDRQHQQSLATDQAEIAEALRTPRRGRAHAADRGLARDRGDAPRPQRTGHRLPRHRTASTPTTQGITRLRRESHGLQRFRWRPYWCAILCALSLANAWFVPASAMPPRWT